VDNEDIRNGSTEYNYMFGRLVIDQDTFGVDILIRVMGDSTMGSRLEWDGCFNARDLGGLPARDGQRTRQGAIIRSDQLCNLTSEGWAAVYS
jgi:Tyrosine phosphatase family